MDSIAQQTTAVKKGGGPAKPRADDDVEVDSPDTINASDSLPNGKEAAETRDKKSDVAKKQSSGNKLKKDKAKKKKKMKKQHVPTDSSSSDSSDDQLSDSYSTSDDTDREAVLPRKRSAKKGQNTLKLKTGKTKKHKSLMKPKSQLLAAPDSESESSGSDSDSASESESSGDDAEDVELVVDQKKKKTRDQGLKQDLGYHVARELQRILQLAQAQPSAPALHSHAGYGAGLDDAGFGAGLSGATYPRSAVLGGLQQGYPSGLGSRSRPIRVAGLPQLGINDTFDERLALLDALGDPLGRGSGLTGRGLRRDGTQADKKQSSHPTDPKKQKSKKANYKRVDQVWDNAIHNFKLQDTAESSTDKQYSGFCFHVRRTFDWEGKYKATVVDIKSKLLRECLQDVMGNIKGVSLVDETPKMDPNVLFLYLEDLRKHLKRLKRQVANPPGPDKVERKKEGKRLEEKRQHLKVLVRYIDKDYEHIKNSLYPMLDHGLITFDLLWALWKPNTLAYAATYGSSDEPRVFKVDTAEKHYHISKGEFYFIDGKVSEHIIILLFSE